MATSIKQLGAAALAGAAVWLLAAPPAFGGFITPSFNFRAGRPLNQNFSNLAVLGRALQNVPPYAFPFNRRAFGFGGFPVYPAFGGGGVSPPLYPYPNPPYGGALTTIPYSAGYGSPYPMSPGYEGGYPPGMTGDGGGMYGAGSQGYGGDSGAGSETSAEAKGLSRVLTAAGVPNDGGRLQWPVGLRVVGGPAGDELRRQIDSLLQYGAGQTQAGPVSANLTQELARSVETLRELLRRDREERFSLALTAYDEAERFLVKLDHARKMLEAGRGAAGGKGGAEGAGS